MNKKRLTLNEELTRMSSLFGYMNMPTKLIMEASNPGEGLMLFRGLEEGSSLAKIMPKATQAAREGLMLQLANKGINSLEEMKLKFGGTMEEAANTFFKSLTTAEQSTFLTKIENVASEENIAALTGLNKLPNVTTEIKNLGNDALGFLEKRQKSNVPLTNQEILVLKDVAEFMEKNAKGNVNIANTAESLKIQIDLAETNVNQSNLSIDFTNNSGDDYVFKKTDLNQNSSLSKNSTGVNNNPSLFDGKRISRNSFVYIIPDFTKMVEGINDLESFNRNMAYALDLISKNDPKGYNYIPRGGFEQFGIVDFRQYCKDNIQMINRVDVDASDWSVTFKASENIKGLDTADVFDSVPGGPKKIQVWADGFKEGTIINPKIGNKVLEDMSPDMLVQVTKEEINKILTWLKSSEYKRRRMFLTSETSEEVDIAIKDIENYIKNNLEITFKWDKEMVENNTYGEAEQYSQRQPWMTDKEGKIDIKTKYIRIIPQETIGQVRNTLNHELDHIVSISLDGGTTNLAYKNFENNIEPFLLKIPDKTINDVGLLKQFVDIKSLQDYNRWATYLRDTPEQFTRLRRLYTFASDIYGSEKLSYEQVSDLWNNRYKVWKKNGPPPGFRDMYDLIYEWEKANSGFFIKDDKKRIQDLQNVLNVVLGVAALVTMNVQPETKTN